MSALRRSGVSLSIAKFASYLSQSSKLAFLAYILVFVDGSQIEAAPGNDRFGSGFGLSMLELTEDCLIAAPVYGTVAKVAALSWILN